MRKALAILAAAGGLAVALPAAANAQVDEWNGGWHVGGDYYQPTDYGYGYLHNYGAPVGGDAAVATVAPVRTVQTIETVRTIRPSRYAARRQIVTRRTTVSQLAYPQPLYDYAASAPAASVPAYNNAAYYNYGSGSARPLYDYAGPAPAVAAPVYNNAAYYNYGAGYARPLYDTVTPVAQTFAAPISAAPFYRYVYQWDRVLVIDPRTGLLVQTLPR